MVEDFILFALVGFAAQAVDGALGMAYGVTATSVLLGLGVPPATASASVHAAEVFTTGASGAAHWRQGNTRREIVWRLAVAGALGGVAGALALVSLPATLVRVAVSAYLLVVGLLLLGMALGRVPRRAGVPRHLVPLGLAGGFLDAIGGGGWGAAVTPTLISQGAVPRVAVGSANLAEFFVALAVSATFLLAIGLELWPMILGLIAGGVVAAPFAAKLARRVPDRALMALVGGVVVLLSIRGLVQALG